MPHVTKSGESAANLQTALNEALVLGLAQRDNANLASLLTEYFGDSISSSEDGSESEDELDCDLPESDQDYPEPMDIVDDEQESEERHEPDNEDQPTLPAVPGPSNTDNHHDHVNVDGDIGLVPDLAQQIVDNEGTDDWTSPDNDEELHKIRNFSNCTCARNRNKNNPCTNLFDESFIIQLRAQMTDADLTGRERKMYIMGKISTTIRKTAKTQCVKRALQKDRERSRVTYLVEGVQVCRKSFVFMHNIGNDQLSGIIKQYQTHGVVPPYKKSGGRCYNKRALSDKDIRRTVGFIVNYAEVNGMVIPGRVSGVKCSDPRVRLLPSRDNKSSIWRQYRTQLETLNEAHRIAGEPELRIAKRTSFSYIWRRYTPFILTTKPMSDLCWQCQRNNNAVYRSANMLEELKLERVRQQEEHLHVVAMERDFYRKMVADSKATVDKDVKLGINEPCSREGQMHYAFDFAQQVHYPNDPLQPGPVYFLCPRKCGLFGVACEAIPQQVNYIIDEGVAVGKGSNAVISYVHDFFDNFGLGEQDVHLHCDNCSGQNKNKYVMWYLAWRAINALHMNITVNFMIAGHTKFAPDWCFGLVKQRYRRSMVSCLRDMEEVVRSSSVTGVNVPRLVRTEDGQVTVRTYDWQKFLSTYFVPFLGIKSCHHMRFSNEHPGKVFTKLTAESEEQEYQMLRNSANLPPRDLPQALSIPGLSSARVGYLHKHIREFCTAETRDITCPAPKVVPSKPESMPTSDDSSDEDVPLAKISRLGS